MNPLVNKNAATISQIVVFEKPLKTVWRGRVPVSATTIIPIKVTAPIGIGFKISPRIVAANIARRRMPAGWTPSGTGRNQSENRTMKIRITLFLSRIGLSPFLLEVE